MNDTLLPVQKAILAGRIKALVQEFGGLSVKLEALKQTDPEEHKSCQEMLKSSAPS